MIQVMHTVANYVHDAKYKMPDRPLPCFYQGFLSKILHLFSPVTRKQVCRASIKGRPVMHIRTVLL